MRIQPIYDRTHFGNLCGIRCNENFRNGTCGYIDKRALLINDLMESEAFKELGEHVDYDAVFNFHKNVLNTRTYRDDAFSYELKLVPAKKPTPGKKFRNLPSEISVLECKSTDPYDAYDIFRKKLNNIEGNKLCNKVKKELISWLNQVRQTSRIKKSKEDELERAKKAIRNSKIPIDFDV